MQTKQSKAGDISLLACIAILVSANVLGATATVTTSNNDGAGSLRNAIASAASGDTINFNLTYPATIMLSSPLMIGTNLNIVGPGASNLAISGGAAVRIFSIGSGVTATISGATLENGYSAFPDFGGAIYNNGTLTVSNSTIRDNAASYGGGIYNTGTLTVGYSVLSTNSASAYGGGYGAGIYNSYGTLTVTHSTLSTNYAATAGGGINNLGTAIVTNSTLYGNESTNHGGGVVNSGSMTIVNSTLMINSAQYGGGISSSGPLSVINSTFALNSATNFNGNQGLGSAIFNDGGLIMKNTIVANSFSGGNCYLGSLVTSYGYNLSDDATCHFVGIGDMNSTQAGLNLGQQANGGPTLTLALLATSPALDAIPTSPTNYCTLLDGTTPIATDQRDVIRPQGSGCDIGAFEVGLPVVSNLLAVPDPVAVGSAIALTATIDDSTTGSGNIASAQYNINGGAFSAMQATDFTFDQATENVFANVPPFSTTGIYNICVTGTNLAGITSAPSCIPLPVYDPSAGFVTGGGSIFSPIGKDLVNTSASGPATFGFVSKYLPGANTPSGNLEFHFDAGNLHFKSTSMDWLVVTGQPRGQFHGIGMINGSIVCQFAVDAWSKSFPTPSGQVDAFGMKVYSCNSGGDSMGSRYSIDATPLSSGSIIIHK